MMSDDSIEETITNEKKEAEAIAKKTNRTTSAFSTEAADRTASAFSTEAADRTASPFSTEAADGTTKTDITTV